MKTHVSTEALLAVLERRAPRPLSIAELADMLGMEHYDRKQMRAGLEAAADAGKLRRIGKTRYLWLRGQDRPLSRREGRGARVRGGGRRVEGRYCRVRGGYGFVEVLGKAAHQFPRDILIPEGMEAGALHGDRVEVEIARHDPRTRRFTGRVVNVTGPVHERIIGTLERRRGAWLLIPENELLPPVELIGPAQPDAGDAGKVALAQLTRPPSATTTAGGELVEVLGSADDPEVQFLSIAFEHGLRTEFPTDVLAEADALPADPAGPDFAGREDLRELPFVTIDGETARDFDDAVCLEALPRNGWRLRVAIADVSHYVRPGSALDGEAARRGTSVYFPDRAIPMLPEALSNGLCSLKPDRDRLVLVAEMDYDPAGQRRRARLYRGVIRSRARLTYTQVAALLTDADSPEIRAWREALVALLPQLRHMQALMRVFYRNRVAHGSLDLDLPEALVDLSEEGRSVGLRLLQRNDAHRLIEEFMLEANQAVALHLHEHDVPFPYRIHEPPDPDDIDELNLFLQAFGFRIDYAGRVRPQDVQAVLAAMRGHRLERVLSRLLLRSLKQAQYSTDNAGHFGLAFSDYCHFTSPIRRYPDLLVHRQLGRVFDGEAERARGEGERMEASSVQSSQCEREAMAAERAMLDLKKAEFMLGHLLEPEAGTVVSVQPFGVFVELDAYPVEGLVRVEELGDERFRHIEREHALRGLRSGQRVRLGDRVIVEASNVSLRRRQIDLTLLERIENETPPRPARPKRTAPHSRQRNRRSR